MAQYQLVAGPFLATAVFCEEAVHEEGFLSLDRVIDQMLVTGMGPLMEPTQLQLTLVVLFRSGGVRGRKTIYLTQVAPSQKSAPLFEFPVYFQGDERAAGVVAKVSFVVEEVGLHWFVVALDGAPVTAIPLTVVYHGT